MADLSLFDDIELVKPDLGDLSDPKNNSASNQNGLSDFQRDMVKNYFDTQPKRRAAYLKQLGYEMNPKDEEMYRPIGSNGEFQPIEPDNTVLGIIPFYKFWTEEGQKELKRDISDIGFDTAVEGPIVGGMAALTAAKLGGTAAAASGPAAPVAGTAGTILGIGIGGAAGKAVAETIKTGIGDFLLDEDIPMDLKETMYQSLITGAMGAGLKKFGNMITNWKGQSAKEIADSLKDAAIRKSGGTFNQELADDFAVNPQNYTPEAVDGATARLMDLSDEIFGTTVDNPHSTRQLKGGVARQAIDPLNKRADLEIAKLAEMKEARFSFDEIQSEMLARTKEIRGKTFKTKEEIQALKYVDRELGRMKKTLQGKPTMNILGPDGNPIPLPPKFKEVNFKEGRDFLKSLQNAAYQEGPTKGNAVLAKVAHGLKEKANKKAEEAGSDLPEINIDRSEILSLYKTMHTQIKNGAMQNATIGKDSISKQQVGRLFQKMDKVLGTNLFDRVKSAQFQAAVEGLYKNPRAFGSGSVMKDALKEGFKQASTEGFKWGIVGSALLGPMGGVKAGTAGAAVGFTRGLREGASLASPETFVKNISKIKTRIDKIDASKSGPRNFKEAMAQGARSPISQATAQLDTRAARGPEEELPPQATAQAPASGPGQAPGFESDPNMERQPKTNSLLNRFDDIDLVEP